MIYLALTRSDKAGGVNAQALANPDTFTSEVYRQQLLNNSSFDPATLYSLEYGVKGRSLDDSLTIKMAAFYNYRQDPQLKSTITDKDDNASPVFVDFIDNAGAGRGYGLELEADYQATDSISLFLTAGYLQTKIKDYVVVKEDEPNIDMNNRDMAHAPEYQFSAGINYHNDFGFYAGVELQGKDSFYFSNSHSQQSKSYVLTNISTGYQALNWRVNLAANNVFDKDYAVRGFYFPNDPRDGYQLHNYIQFGAPATLNLSLEVNW